MNGRIPYNGRRERERRARQTRAGIVTPSLLREDILAVERAVAAVGHGRHDGEVDAQTFDVVEDAFGRWPVYLESIGRIVSSHCRFTDPAKPGSLMVKGRALTRAA